MRRTTLALVGVPLTLATAFGLLLYDLTHSNRPHELRFVPWVGALAAVSVWLSGLALVELFRRIREPGTGRWRIRAGLCLALAGMLPGLGLLGLALVGLLRS